MIVLTFARCCDDQLWTRRLQRVGTAVFGWQNYLLTLFISRSGFSSARVCASIPIWDGNDRIFATPIRANGHECVDDLDVA